MATKSGRPGFGAWILGLISLGLGVAMCIVALAVYFSGGFDAIYWLPVLFLLTPLNYVIIACVPLSILFGILAIGTGGWPRRLGWAGIYCALLQVAFFASLIISIAVVEAR